MPDSYNQSLEYLRSLRGTVDGVQILSMRDGDVCEPCFDHDGTFYHLAEALEEEPLPHDGCSNDECRCTYRPVDREKFLKEKRMREQDSH